MEETIQYNYQKEKQSVLEMMEIEQKTTTLI